MDALYQKGVVCAQCGRDFQTSRVRPSYKKAVKTDADFCTYYKEGQENPEFYVVRVCPFCGYASTDNSMKSLTDRQKAEFTAKIGATWTMKDYGGRRKPADAMAAYKLALLSAQVVGESDRVIAGLLHHIAWLYRYQGDGQGEMRFLAFAVEAYTRVYEKDGFDSDSGRLMFLIGELYRRLKNYGEAANWFSRVMRNKQSIHAGIVRSCRESWDLMREEMAAAKLEPSEELQRSAGE